MKSFVLLLVAAVTLTACHESLEDRCAREAKEYTEKYCPAPGGKNLIIDSMAFDRTTHTLSYYYSLKGDIDNAAIIQKQKNFLHKQMLGVVRNATTMKTYKDAGYSFRYVYHSSKDKGQVLYDQTITKKEY